MTVTPDQIVAFAPELAGLDPDDVQASIDSVERRTNRSAWGVKADDGVTYLVCHALTLRRQIESAGATGARGPVVSEKAGPVSRTYAEPVAAPFSQAWFTSTSYGQAYLDLRSLLFADRVI